MWTANWFLLCQDGLFQITTWFNDWINGFLLNIMKHSCPNCHFYGIQWYIRIHRRWRRCCKYFEKKALWLQFSHHSQIQSPHFYTYWNYFDYPSLGLYWEKNFLPFDTMLAYIVILRSVPNNVVFGEADLITRARWSIAPRWNGYGSWWDSNKGNGKNVRNAISLFIIAWQDNLLSKCPFIV